MQVWFLFSYFLNIFSFQPGYVCENGSCVEECLNECCADEDCPVDMRISILCGNFNSLVFRLDMSVMMMETALNQQHQHQSQQQHPPAAQNAVRTRTVQ